jgi:hypothetical protein
LGEVEKPALEVRSRIVLRPGEMFNPSKLLFQQRLEIEAAIQADPRLNLSDKSVWRALAARSGLKTDHVWPGHDKIAIEAGISERQAIYSVKKLIEKMFMRYRTGVRSRGGRPKRGFDDHGFRLHTSNDLEFLVPPDGFRPVGKKGAASAPLDGAAIAPLDSAAIAPLDSAAIAPLRVQPLHPNLYKGTEPASPSSNFELSQEGKVASSSSFDTSAARQPQTESLQEPEKPPEKAKNPEGFALPSQPEPKESATCTAIRAGSKITEAEYLEYFEEQTGGKIGSLAWDRIKGHLKRNGTGLAEFANWSVTNHDLRGANNPVGLLTAHSRNSLSVMTAARAEVPAKPPAAEMCAIGMCGGRGWTDDPTHYCDCPIGQKLMADCKRQDQRRRGSAVGSA